MRTIGKYQDLTALARGGSGQLYKAYDPATDRHVAIKMLVATNDQRQLKRFRDEARAAGRLQHPNVVSIYACEVEDGIPYLVMEFLEGHDLSWQLRRSGGATLFEALEIMFQVAKGLDHAHSNGVIHRDVTPQNIWLLPDGTAKIIDFGFASNLLDTQGSWHHDRGGTLHYMSPEHIANEDYEQWESVIDARSDIFSYGTVFYQLVSGQLPFAAEDERNVILGIQMKEPAPVQSLAPDCPEALAAIIHRALEKEPHSRFQSFKRLLFELDPIVSDSRRHMAQWLVAEAEGFLQREELEGGEALVGRAMKLVDDFQPARELHLRIQSAQETRAARLLFEAKLRQSDEFVQQSNFDAAIRILELLPESEPLVSSRLRSARVSFWLAEARRCLDGQDFEEALRSVSQALITTDEGNAEALELQQRILSEIENRKQQQLEEALGEAKNLLKEKDYLTALILLEPLEQDYPHSVLLLSLLSYAREEVNKRRRDAARENTTAKVQAFTAYGQFESALAIIEQALTEYPGDLVLIKLKEATSSAIANRESPHVPSDKLQCRHCGNVLFLASRFCDKCGKRLTD